MQTLLSRNWHHLPPSQAVELLHGDAERGLIITSSLIGYVVVELEKWQRRLIARRRSQ
jgi:hypothetical protein